MRAIGIALLAVILSAVAIFGAAQAVGAARGTPGSPDYGVGVTLYPNPADLSESMTLCAKIQPDWVYVPLDWAQIAPQADGMDWSVFDQITAFAGKNQLALAVSVRHAPAWAMTPQGPDATLSAALISELIGRYKGIVQAVEVFPGANTIQGWGAAPDPGAYLQLFGTVHQVLAVSQPAVLLVAGGLQPVNSITEDIDDLDYLKNLYDLGAANQIQVVSLQYTRVVGEPLDAPVGENAWTLRHYEQVRRIMTKNQHASGLVWITALITPDGLTPDEQTQWLRYAAVQTRGQLYIASSFFGEVNTSVTGASEGTLLRAASGKVHPFTDVLAAIMQSSQDPWMIDMPGRPKDNFFSGLR